jgi:hypothetical protein
MDQSVAVRHTASLALDTCVRTVLLPLICANRATRPKRPIPFLTPSSDSTKLDVSTYITCPPQYQQQPQQQTRQEQHPRVYCDGPRCRGATQCIVGPRYVCANCPPSIDLCQECYTSKAAHNISHSFKRFDKAGLTTFVLCSPQMQQQQQQQTCQEEQHVNV